MKKNLYIFGNSHVSQFSESDEIVPETDSFVSFESENFIYHLKRLGPCTAYNFFWNPSYFQRLLTYLSFINKEKDYVSIFIGEIDCRWHIARKADEQKIDYNVAIEEVVDRLFVNYIHLKNLGFNLIVFSVHPGSTYPPSDNPSSPVYGDYIKRNMITRKFNELLKHKCKIHKLIYCDYFDELMIDEYAPNMDFFMDYVHLKGTIVRPIIENRLLKIMNVGNL